MDAEAKDYVVKSLVWASGDLVIATRWMMERWEGENPSTTRQEIVEELRKVRIAADVAIKALQALEAVTEEGAAAEKAAA
jgi:hypothetical protein